MLTRFSGTTSVAVHSFLVCHDVCKGMIDWTVSSWDYPNEVSTSQFNDKTALLSWITTPSIHDNRAYQRQYQISETLVCKVGLALSL